MIFLLAPVNALVRCCGRMLDISYYPVMGFLASDIKPSLFQYLGSRKLNFVNTIFVKYVETKTSRSGNV